MQRKMPSKLRFLRATFFYLACVQLFGCHNFGDFWSKKTSTTSSTGASADTTPPTTPGSPSAIAAGSTQLNLTWTASSDNVDMPAALVYEICQNTSAGACNTFTVVFTSAASATTFSATGLTPSTTYYYRIRAQDTAGNNSVETSEFSASTSAPGTVNTPTYSPAAGTYSSPQSVTIASTTLGATICYTTDGSTPACSLPSCSVGTLYGLAPNISVTTTLKAIACKSGDTDSTLASGVYTIDTTPPTVSNVSASTANGTYGPGQTVSVQVTFSEAINVTGTPQISLATGTPASTPVNYVSGSGSTILVFNYIVASGNNSADLDYAATTALALNGGSIQDLAGNAANLTLANPGSAGSLGANKAIVIDGVGPSVSGVTASTADGIYGVGSTISVQVNFSEPVNVTGTPQLTLATGSPATTAINYTSGTGSATLVFTYTIAAGNISSDLDYATSAALTLGGGAINDTWGNPATLTLAAPGAATSLGANKAIVVDTGGLTLGTAISFASITSTGMVVNWGTATDDNTPVGSLQYKLVKDNAAAANINTVSLADAKTGADKLMDWTTNIATYSVAGLTASTTYYFAVLVKDGAGNMALYTPAAQATSAPPATKRFVILSSGSTKVTSIYNSATHTFSAGPSTSYTPSSGSNNFLVTTGANAGKILVMISGGPYTELYDIAGNTFAVGPTNSFSGGSGTTSFSITTGPKSGQRFYTVSGNSNTFTYDPIANAFTAGVTVTTTNGLGTISFPITSGIKNGQFMIVQGGSNKTSLYDPATDTVTAGPNITATSNKGLLAFLIPSGLKAGMTLVIHGNALSSTSLYDPTTNTVSAGPTLSANANDGSTFIGITTGPKAGQFLIFHGNNTTGTSYYDPATNTITAGPPAAANISSGAHVFMINSGSHVGQTIVINGGGTTATSLFDPAGPSLAAGPTLTAVANAGSNSWDIP